MQLKRCLEAETRSGVCLPLLEKGSRNGRVYWASQHYYACFINGTRSSLLFFMYFADICWNIRDLSRFSSLLGSEKLGDSIGRYQEMYQTPAPCVDVCIDPVHWKAPAPRKLPSFRRASDIWFVKRNRKCCKLRNSAAGRPWYITFQELYRLLDR